MVSIIGVQDLDKIIKDSDYAKLQQDWQDVSIIYEPPRGKTNNVVSKQV